MKLTKTEFLMELSDVIGEDPSFLRGGESLEDLKGWDSLAAISFLFMVDQVAGVTLTAEEIAESETIDRLYDLVVSKVS